MDPWGNDKERSSIQFFINPPIGSLIEYNMGRSEINPVCPFTRTTLTYNLSTFIGNISDVEKKNRSIVIDGMDTNIVMDIIDNNSYEEYGIVDIEYDDEDDTHTLIFTEEMYNTLLEEYKLNN